MSSKVERHSEEAEKAVRDLRRATTMSFCSASVGSRVIVLSSVPESRMRREQPQFNHVRVGARGTDEEGAVLAFRRAVEGRGRPS
jgi:hypothetical protein